MTQFASTLYPQTNPTNPVLLAMREPGRDREAFIREFLASPRHYRWPHQSTDEVVHARRVIERLAALPG